MNKGVLIGGILVVAAVALAGGVLVVGRGGEKKTRGVPGV